MTRAKPKTNTPSAASTKADAPATEPKAKAMAEDTNQRSRSGDTVTVGLKSPNGIILRLQRKDTVRFATRDGGMKEIDEWHPDYESASFTLNGNRVAHGEQPRCIIVGGFAMTSGIPKDFWDAWKAQNANLDLVKNGMILAYASDASARDAAKDGKNLKSGLEPLNMSKNNPDKRLPTKKDRDGETIAAIETGDEQPKSAAAA